MSWQFSVFSIVMMASTLAGLLAAIIVWGRRIFRGGYALTLMMLAVAEWSLAQALEVSLTDIPTKILFSKLSYIGIVSVPVLLFTFTVRYLKKDAWLKKQNYLSLWLVPAITFLLVMTNERHHLIWSGFTTRIVLGYISIVYGHGIWFWVSATYIYMVSFVSAFLLLQVAYRMYAENRAKTLILILAAILPSLANILYLLGPGWFNVMDFTPVAFTITGLLLVYALFGFYLFSYSPLLRNLLVENMTGGILALDFQGRIIDINKTAKRLLEVKDENPHRKHVESVVNNSQFLDCIRHPGAGQKHLQVAIETGDCILDVSNITGPEELELAGNFYLIRDVTLENKAERELRSHKEILDGIFDGVPAMIGYVDRHKRYLAVNQPYADWYHLKKEDIVGKTISEVLTDPDAYRKADQYYNEVLRGNYVSFENVVQAGSKKKIVDVKFVPHFDDNNEVKAFFALIQDITDKKRIEETEVKARKLAEAIQNAGMAISSSLDYEQVLLLILEQISTVISLDTAAILLLQDERLNRVAIKGNSFGANLVGTSYHLADSPAENQVISGKKVVNSSDVLSDYPSLIRPPFESIKSWLGIPLIFKDDVIGMLSLGSHEPRHFSEEDERVAPVFAAQVAIALENARVFDKMKQMAMIDMLTGLFNRRHLFTLGDMEFERARRYDKEMSLVMMDLDHFKAINDQFGHKAGDLILQTIAARCLEAKRKADIIGRYGGEEFVMILPETDIANAAHSAERLRKIIEETKVTAQNGAVISVTASLGVAERAYRVSSFEGMLDMADRALYSAKQKGRNRVEVFGDRLIRFI